MGAGTSKYFRLKNEKNRSAKKSALKTVYRKSSEIKEDVLKQLKSSCVARSTHIGKGGVAFYTPLEDDLEASRHAIAVEKSEPVPCRASPQLSHSDVLSDSFTAKEREIMADVIKADSLRERGRWAKITEERRLLALRRREEREEQTKQRHLQKMREAELRRQALQERPRPTQWTMNNLYRH